MDERLRGIEKHIKRLQEEVAETRSFLNADNLELELESDAQRVFRSQNGPILNEIDRRGGSVAAAELSEITRRHGKDPRGVGGFANGRTPLLRSEGEHRVLTARGKGEAARWRAMYGGDEETK